MKDTNYLQDLLLIFLLLTNYLFPLQVYMLMISWKTKIDVNLAISSKRIPRIYSITFQPFFGLFLGPFRATQIWNEIVDHLKTHVEVKRRRYKMKTYDNSFSGAHAVDVVMTYLLSEKNTFSTDLSRDKAVKVGIL